MSFEGEKQIKVAVFLFSNVKNKRIYAIVKVYIANIKVYIAKNKCIRAIVKVYILVTSEKSKKTYL